MWHCVRELEMDDVFYGWNAGLSLQRRWLLSWVCFMGKILSLLSRDLGQTFHVKSQMRQSACFIGNIPKTQFYWGMF